MSRRSGPGRSTGDRPVIFPGDHGGFGQQGEPVAFAATLREVLANTV